MDRNMKMAGTGTNWFHAVSPNDCLGLAMIPQQKRQIYYGYVAKI